MAKYRTKSKSFEATQWSADVKIPGMKVIASTGPDGTMHYLKCPDGREIRLRDKDWVVVGDDGKVSIAPKAYFDATYEPA